MLTSDMIKTLKQVNISVDSELTKHRTKGVLKAASREQKRQIDAFAGLKRASINRVYTTGSISVKIAVAVAHVLNINPYYLTGEVSEPGECSDELLAEFLAAKGYKDIAEKAAKPPRKPRQKRTPKVAVAEVSMALPPELAEPVIAPAPAPEALPPAGDFTEEEAVILLRALFVRAQYGGDCGGTLAKVKALLIGN